MKTLPREVQKTRALDLVETIAAGLWTGPESALREQAREIVGSKAVNLSGKKKR